MSPTGNDVKSPPTPDGDERTRRADTLGDADADELTLAAEAAEAEAQAAEARAAAARARVRAAELRRRARTSPRSTDPAASEQARQLSNGDAARGEPGDDLPPDDRSDSRPMDSTPAEEGRDAAEDPAEPASRSRGARLRGILGRRPRGRSARIAVAVAVIALALAGSGYSVWHHHEVTEKDRRAAEFTAAARQGVVALTTLDFNRAKDDVQRVLDNSTGSFRGDFQARAADFTTVVQQSQVTTEGKVNATAIESMTEDSAVVLVAATSQVTNSAGARQEPRAWRLSVTVTRDGDQLKMSKVEFVP